MTAIRIHTDSAPTTAHPPLPRQPTMQEWLNRPRKRGLLRLFEVRQEAREMVA